MHYAADFCIFVCVPSSQETIMKDRGSVPVHFPECQASCAGGKDLKMTDSLGFRLECSVGMCRVQVQHGTLTVSFVCQSKSWYSFRRHLYCMLSPASFQAQGQGRWVCM